MELSGFISLLISLFIYWLFFIVKTSGQIFLSKPQHAKVVVGGNLTLECTVTEEDPTKMHVIWMRHDPLMTFSVNTMIVSGDHRVSIEGKYNLRIENVTLKDEGKYQCMATKTGSSPVTQESTVLIIVPPTATIISPAENITDVMVNGSIELDCEVHGKPAPKLFWTRKDLKLPSGDEFYEGNPLVLTQVDYDDGGMYVCSANNSFGDTSTDETEISVTYAPSIEVDKHIIYSGPDFDTILTCLVSGNPTPEVIWYFGNEQVEDGERQNIGKGSSYERKQKYTLVLKELTESDFGNYSCVANNSLGTTSQVIELSGLPSELNIESDPVGEYANEYFLQWTLISYAPPEEYKLLLYKVSENATEEEIEKTIPAEHSGRLPVRRTQGYLITDLEPSSDYRVRLFVKNVLGWGRKGDRFMFQTNKAGTTPPPEGVHYGSEGPQEGNGTVININGADNGAEGNGRHSPLRAALLVFLFACAYA